MRPRVPCLEGQRASQDPSPWLRLILPYGSLAVEVPCRTGSLRVGLIAVSDPYGHGSSTQWTRTVGDRKRTGQLR